MILLTVIDRVRTAGVRFECVLADAGYGLSGPCCQGLSERRLTWAVDMPAKQKVYPADVAMILPVAGRGRPSQRHNPGQLSVVNEKVLADQPWVRVNWRRGTKGRLAARFAPVRVRMRIADGPPQRIRDMGARHLPGEKAWLLGEHRSEGERKHYLATLPADTSLEQLAPAVKARWECEQMHQQLGPEHPEGRSWTGLHRHALMTMIAYVFLKWRRLAQAERKKSPRATAAAQPARGQASHHHRGRPAAAGALPALCPAAHPSAAMICQSSARLPTFALVGDDATFLVEGVRQLLITFDRPVGLIVCISARPSPSPIDVGEDRARYAVLFGGIVCRAKPSVGVHDVLIDAAILQAVGRTARFGALAAAARVIRKSINRDRPRVPNERRCPDSRNRTRVESRR